MYACPKHVRTDHPVLVYKTCEIEQTVLRLFSCLPPSLSLPAYTLHSQSSTLPIFAYSSVTSTSSISLLLRYYHNSSRSWQLDALHSLPTDMFKFVSLPGHQIVMMDDVASTSPTIKVLAANVQGSIRNSLDLFKVHLVDLEQAEVRGFIWEMLDKAARISAELVHLGLLEAPVSLWFPCDIIVLTRRHLQQTEWNEICTEYSQKLLTMFLAGHPNYQLVFMRIWQIHPAYLTNAFAVFYKKSPLNLTRILDVAQDLKAMITPLT